MNRPGLKVFLSSTFADLFMERQAVEAVIHRMALTYVGMEHFGSFASEPLEECKNRVRTSDVLILALGNRYGSKPEGNVMSFTEAEYREAERHEKPVLVYFASYSSDSEIDKEADELRQLKADVSKKHGVSEFDSGEDLSWKVACDLYRELPRFHANDVPELNGRTEELAGLFRRRADAIERDLSPHYKYVSVKAYLDEFRLLHKEHVSYIRDGNLILAHEVVNRIHELSARLESDEFWTRHRIETPGVLYSLNLDAFENGPISNVYGNGFPCSRWAIHTEKGASQLYTEALEADANGT